MKSAIYLTFAFLFAFFVGMFLLRQYVDTRLHNAPLCGHIDRVTAWKDGQKTFHGLNEIGQDVSCYVSWKLNGKSYYSEWWNIGNCSDSTPIEIDVIDYTCH